MMLSEPTLPQALLLLCLHDQSGKAEAGYYQPAIAGAALAELLLAEVIELSSDEPARVIPLRHNKKLGTFLTLCDVEIGSSPQTKTLSAWINRLANMKGLIANVADELCHLGALSQEKTRIFGIFQRTVWPEASPALEQKIIGEMARAMFDDSLEVDERMSVLISLAISADVLKHNFNSGLLRRHAARIKSIGNGEMLGASAAEEVIHTTEKAIAAATAIEAASAATIIT
jgi:hypothetical protein